MHKLFGGMTLAAAAAMPVAAQDAPTPPPVVVVFDVPAPEPEAAPEAAPESAANEEGRIVWGLRPLPAGRANCSEHADIVAATGTDAPRYDAQGNLIRTDHCTPAAPQTEAQAAATARRGAFEPDVRQECYEDETSSGCSSSVSFGNSETARQASREALDALREED